MLTKMNIKWGRILEHLKADTFSVLPALTIAMRRENCNIVKPHNGKQSADVLG